MKYKILQKKNKKHKRIKNTKEFPISTKEHKKTREKVQKQNMNKRIYVNERIHINKRKKNKRM